MDSTIMIVVIALVIIAGIFFLRRNRPAAPGTYDDPDVRSSGSIGGGTRAHDDPKVRSGGSIGGTQVYDSPEHVSEGSIGGQSKRRRRTRADGSEVNEPDEDELDEDLSDKTDGVEKPRYNDPNVRSKGSFGS